MVNTDVAESRYKDALKISRIFSHLRSYWAFPNICGTILSMINTGDKINTKVDKQSQVNNIGHANIEAMKDNQVQGIPSVLWLWTNWLKSKQCRRLRNSLDTESEWLSHVCIKITNDEIFLIINIYAENPEIKILEWWGGPYTVEDSGGFKKKEKKWGF